MSPDAPKRTVPKALVAGAIVAVLLSIYLLLQGFGTFLIFWAIFGPMLIAGALVVFGSRRFPGGLPWVVGAGFALIPAAYMTFSSLCERGEGSCPADLSNSHKAVWALIALAIGWALLFLVRTQAGRSVFMALAAFGMIWMFLRLRTGEHMEFAAVIILVILAAGIVFEVVKVLRARAIEAELQQMAAAGGSPAAPS